MLIKNFKISRSVRSAYDGHVSFREPDPYLDVDLSLVAHESEAMLLREAMASGEVRIVPVGPYAPLSAEAINDMQRGLLPHESRPAPGTCAQCAGLHRRVLDLENARKEAEERVTAANARIRTLEAKLAEYKGPEPEGATSRFSLLEVDDK